MASLIRPEMFLLCCNLQQVLTNPVENSRIEIRVGESFS
jgi:hypothetical protein